MEQKYSFKHSNLFSRGLNNYQGSSTMELNAVNGCIWKIISQSYLKYKKISRSGEYRKITYSLPAIHGYCPVKD